jgi:hypothetical protein
MSFEAGEDLAMILPIPVKKGTGDGGIQFVNLEKYPKIFDDMEKGFPVPPSIGISRDTDSKFPTQSLQLKVEEVGSFEASFVPTMDDFDRLDPRFRIEKNVWAKIPGYESFGFAVFQLKAGKRQHVHPMAFTFPTADTGQIFFPTVHIHDGEVHPKEHFDHSLYCQTDSNEVKMIWEESTGHARQFLKERLTKETIRPDEHVYKLSVRGKRKNEDILAAS